MAKGIRIALLTMIILIIIGGMVWTVYQRNNGDENGDEVAVLEEIELADNEMSEGQIVFTVPKEYECSLHETEVDGANKKYLMINNDSYLYYGILGTFDDKNTSRENFDVYWGKYLNEQAASSVMEFIDQGMTIVNENECYYRIAKYFADGVYIYVRMYLIFDDRTDKVCAVVLYDNNKTDEYVDEVLESVRFL